MEGRVLEVEQSLLAAILIRPEIFRATKVAEEDFSDPRNRKIFRAMGELDLEGVPLTPDLLYQKLGDRELLKYMVLLSDNGISANWKYYDQKVREYSCKRKFAELGAYLSHWAKNDNHIGETIEKFKERFNEIRWKLLGKKPIHEMVRQWVKTTGGIFRTSDVHRELMLTKRGDKQTANMALLRLEKEGVIKRHGDRRGTYRLVESLSEIIDHENADDTPLDIILPFGLHKHMEWFPKGIGVVAGDTDSGKTTIMLNLAHDNQSKFPRVVYIATEMGRALLKRRLQKFCQANDCFYPDAVKGITFHNPKTRNLMDLVEPDAFNIIDYYELSGDQFRDVADYFRQIYDRLDKGVCFIALQKKFGASLGRAAELAMEKPLLYLALHRGGIARIEKCKTEWTEDFQPYAIEFKYKIWGGGKLLWGKRLRSKKEARNCEQ
jgi:DNA-binding PadR family transcriptional regulator